MTVSPNFSEDVGTKPGLEIWRIENFAPVPYKKQSYGLFFSGDAYIVLSTREIRNKLKWDIHFWLGKNASQDEIGAAAILSVELDNLLGGVPVQHREVQDHESSVFLSYFPSGVRYMEGGVASGFRNVSDEEFEKKLLKIKGKRNVRVVQVPLDISSMNRGDCFVLDTKRTIYVYVGRGSKRTERIKAVQAANQVRDQDHAGKGQVVILDEYADGGQLGTFFEELGSGSPAEVPEGSDEDDDAAFEQSRSKSTVLYHVSDASGSLEVKQIGEKVLQHAMLNKEDCYILDTAGSGIFVWVGSRCTKNEKSQAMNIAEKFLKEKGYPIWTKVHRVVDGGEPTMFRQYFASWKDKDETGLPIPRSVTADRTQLAEFDVKTLHRDKLRLLLKQGGAAPGFYPDDGSGKKEIYRVEEFELKPVDEATYGMFFGGDSYVIKYTYGAGGERYIIYFWQGKESSQDEKAAAAIHAAQLDNQLNGMAVQVRVPQGHEPRHFIKMFQGRMVVFSGGRASGFRNITDYDTYDVDGTRLFHVRGFAADDMRAVQVPEVASSLDSNDVFVLETPSKTFIWNGSTSSQEEKDLGVQVANMVSPNHTKETISEGEEPEEFWSSLGGKGSYTTEPPETAPSLKTRLFHCTLNAVGRLRVEEIKPFKQEDLVEDDVMVLDSGVEIYVWIGKLASDAEREAGWRMAQEYLRTEPSPRTVDSSIILLVQQGKEPDSFMKAFPNWSDNMWKDQKTWEQIKAEAMSYSPED